MSFGFGGNGFSGNQPYNSNYNNFMGAANPNTGGMAGTDSVPRPYLMAPSGSSNRKANIGGSPKPTNNIWQNPAQQTGSVSNWDKRQQAEWDKNPGGVPPAFDLTQSPIYGQLQQLLQQLSNPQAQNEYFTNAVEKPALQTYQRDILPQLKNSYYTGNGVYGSALNRALNRSAEDLALGLGERRANFNMTNSQNSLATLLGLTGQHQQGMQNFFNASPQTPLVQGPSNGWLKDLLEAILGIAGKGAQGYGEGLAQR